MQTEKGDRILGDETEFYNIKNGVLGQLIKLPLAKGILKTLQLYHIGLAKPIDFEDCIAIIQPLLIEKRNHNEEIREEMA